MISIWHGLFLYGSSKAITFHHIKQLSKQYWRYGFWKLQMLKRYPSTLRWRQALPPIFVLTNIIGIIFALFNRYIAHSYLCLLGIYLLILFAASIREAMKKKEPALLLGLPAAIITMHFSWGLGFLFSAITRQ